MSSHEKRGRSTTWIYHVGYPIFLEAHSSLPAIKDVLLDSLQGGMKQLQMENISGPNEIFQLKP